MHAVILKKELNDLLDLIEGLGGVTQPAFYHPEVDALQHTLQVFKIARQRSNDKDLILASLLHDVGKSISSHNHAALGVNMLKGFSFINEKILWLIDNHLRIALLQSGEMKSQSKINKLVNNKHYHLLVELREFDVSGREPNVYNEFDREAIIKYLFVMIAK